MRPSPSLPPTRTFTVGGVSFTMLLVKHGSFMMGATPEQGIDDDADDDEQPIHKVTISRDFYLGQSQVTQALWQAVMGNNPSLFKGDTDLPVESISWDDCQKFLQKLNNQVGDGTFSLPTEAEWEFAARGGNMSKHYKYAGSDDLDEVAWWDENSGSKTQPVAQKKPNELGLYDMSCNVWEWCADWYADYPSTAVTDPTGPQQGDSHVLRGGCYDDFNARGLRVSYRRRYYTGFGIYFCGFRLLFRP